MRNRLPFWTLLVVCHFAGSLALAQGQAGKETIQIPPPKATPVPIVDKPPPPDLVAATVNGQPILEMAVFRGLMQVNPQFRTKFRPDLLNQLVDNVIVDQYLTQLKIEVSAKEVDDHLAKIKAEGKNGDYEKMLEKLHLTESELRHELGSFMKWEKFVAQQGTDKALRSLFEQNRDMFNGAKMQARHILLKCGKENRPEAEAKIIGIKKQIEAAVAQEVAKLPPSSDKITVEKERAKALEKFFSAAALAESTCPSRDKGGDLGYFPRVGAMVEPFARAAFALKPYQMSNPVVTDFGVHLILAVDYRPGPDVKFEDVKRFVTDVYADRLREAVLNSYKPKAKIEIRANPSTK